MDENNIITSFITHLEVHARILEETLKGEKVDYTSSLDLLSVAFSRSMTLFPERKDHFLKLEELVTEYKQATTLLKSYKQHDLVSFQDVIKLAIALGYTKEETKELSAAMLHHNHDMLEDRFHSSNKMD